ncbi:putative ABC transport system permease protein [Parafrankia irregularis]|uniref:Putative ABC transport system permease protein n=1 Tax=Parafrankia irregularis TaxID=795642 RepID=A0A0S4QEN7_9ACTN|nr:MULTISPECIES: ABC transporter permease [Parafrankia]MBE3203336.1 ABC transporter permease [Parafrankia sp. CH37]CUU54016.1 putative ABC transport system permease protein [Parafrankia irregularis]
MGWLETLRTGLDAIRTHRLRSGLTVLGILIGIAAVVLTVGLGVGAQDEVGEEINSLGSNLLIVSPGSSTDSSTGLRGGFGSSSTLTTSDATALTSKTAAPDIEGVAPIKQSSMSLLNGSTNWTTTVVGTTPDWLPVRSRTLTEGRFITTTDEAQSAAVTVLASDTATELFGRRSPVGQSVTINNIAFQVIGVLESAGSDSSSNLDDQAIVPMSTGANRLFGGTTRNSVSTIYIKATSADTLSAAYQEANNLLLNQHSITDSSSADFTITTQDSLLDTATSVSRTLTVLLAGIAALSLLVGGIGVMNIMLVSVTERTREIGLRKALGAPPAAIRRQFLIEASMLSLVGGAVGALLGITGALVLPQFIDNSVAIVWWAVFGSLAVAVAIGVAFGVYPASRAARLAPIDALRSD